LAAELVDAMVALRGGESPREYPGEAVLVHSACQTLLDAPGGLIDSITLSLPAGDDARLAGLQALCRSVVTEYRLRAEQVVKEARLIVRITRPAIKIVGGER
jgi:hypothetical protein